MGCTPQLCFYCSSTASVPRLFICPLKDYLQCKVHCTVQHDVCIVLCTSLCSLCSAHDNCIFYSHSIRTLMEPPGTLGDTQEHSGTLRDTHGTLEDNQGHSWNPQGQSGTLLEPSGTFMEPPMTHRDTHGGSRQIGPWVIFPINWALANRASGKCWCGKLGPSKLGPGKSGPWKMLVHPSNTNVYIGEYMSVEFIYLYYWY